MSNDDFIELVRALQAMGATYVRAGDLEVAIGQGPTAPAWEFEPPEKEEGTPAERARQFLLDHYGSSIPGLR